VVRVAWAAALVGAVVRVAWAVVRGGKTSVVLAQDQQYSIPRSFRWVDTLWMAPLSCCFSLIAVLHPQSPHPGFNRGHGATTTRAGIRTSRRYRACTARAGHRQPYLTMGTQWPRRVELVLALSALMYEPTKFCKPSHQRQCVTARACCFVLLPFLMHALSPLVPVMSVSALRATRLTSPLLTGLHHGPFRPLTSGTCRY
jgi:hypothetical protein